MEVNSLRKKIDRLDTKLLHVLKERFGVVKEIRDLKYKKHLGIWDQSREQEVLKNIKQESKRIGLNTTFAGKLFKLILKESKALQKGDRD